MVAVRQAVIEAIPAPAVLSQRMPFPGGECREMGVRWLLGEPGHPAWCLGFGDVPDGLLTAITFVQGQPKGAEQEDRREQSEACLSRQGPENERSRYTP